MKKNYQQPMMRIVRIQHHGIICTSGGSNKVGRVSSGDTDITYGGGDNGTARVKEQNVWDEEW